MMVEDKKYLARLVLCTPIFLIVFNYFVRTDEFLGVFVFVFAMIGIRTFVFATVDIISFLFWDSHDKKAE
jgi:hypothetical protein